MEGWGLAPDAVRTGEARGWSRRELLTLSAAALLGLRGSLGRASTARAPRAPRYIIQVLLRGGIDTVYTLDPKTIGEVATGVDVPYGPEGIVEAGPLAFGPHMASLARHAEHMSVLRGVQVKTANHEGGVLQFSRMRTGAGQELPSLLDVLGRHRDGQALPWVGLGNIALAEYSQSYLGGPTYESDRTVMDRVEGLSQEDAELMVRVYEAHLARVASWAPSSERDRTRENIEQVRDFFRRLTEVPPLKLVAWSELDGQAKVGEDMQRALWLVENDLARGVYLKLQPNNWDSHAYNDENQGEASGKVMPMLALLLDGLSKRSNAHGRLLDNTLVIVGSELGRFPKINGNEGKDHFPEVPTLLLGAGLRTCAEAGGAFGETDRELVGRPVSLETGRPADNGVLLNLDDVGATILRICGVDPEIYGYRGRHLRFLEAA